MEEQLLVVVGVLEDTENPLELLLVATLYLH